MPTASVRIQEALGIDSCAELSIHANCTSAYKALYLAHQLLAAGRLPHRARRSPRASPPPSCAPSTTTRRSSTRSRCSCAGSSATARGARAHRRPPGRAGALEVEQTYIESVGGRRPSLMFNRRPALWMNPRQEFEEARHHLRQNFRNALATGVFQEEGGSVFFHGLQRMLARGRRRPGDDPVLPGQPARQAHRRVGPRGVRGARHPARRPSPPTSPSSATAGRRWRSSAWTGSCATERLAPGERIVSFVTEVSKFMQAGYVARHVDAR